ncbi:response regulator transcription factor [Staphylospora marina]|uniref:response regulator transcription factor n=1 Tax=Staphylospora marina TaxID=2490858 RepID=UPI000F5BF81E|nr:LuxR C-terminal-related transcriptional regulator [Staphylospora marina]
MELKALTPEEKQVAILIASGLRDKEIGARLYISKRLVCKRIQSIKKKWSVQSRVSIGIMVCHLGWYDCSEKARVISSQWAKNKHGASGTNFRHPRVGKDA